MKHVLRQDVMLGASSPQHVHPFAFARSNGYYALRQEAGLTGHIAGVRRVGA